MPPLTIDLPHQLDPAEVRRRMEKGVGKLPAHIPGGLAEVAHDWPTPDRMTVDVTAFGQHVPSTLDILPGTVRVTIALPGLLSLMAGPVAAIVRKSGEQLLLPAPDDPKT